MRSTQQLVTEFRPEELRKHRRTKRESQGHFWSRFGVTQSRGSRFEKGAEIPKPVAILLELYFNGVVTDGDLETSHAPEPSPKRNQVVSINRNQDTPEHKRAMGNG